MQYKTLTYQRVKNLGNFETERLEASVELSEHDNPIDSAESLRLTVNYMLAQPISDPTSDIKDNEI